MSAAKVFIVEDQSALALDLKARLGDLGYLIVGIVSTGEAAIQQSAMARPDVVLMDIALTGPMDSVDTAGYIRQHLGIPVIFLAADSDEQTLQRAGVTEPYGYILTPFEDREVATIIEMTLCKHRLERRLSEHEARFRALLENASDIIAVFDAAGQLTYASPASVRLFGLSPLTLLTDLLSAHVSPDDVGRMLDVWRAVRAQSGASRSMGEVQVRIGDGTWRTLTGTVTNLLADPTLPGMIVNAYDITSHTSAQETLERLFIAEQRHARELAALNVAFRTMASSLELPRVLAAITDELKRLIEAESVSVLLLHEDELEFVAASGPGADALVGTRLPAAAGLAGAVLRSRAPLMVTDAQLDERFYRAIDVQTGLTTRSLLAVPLLKDGCAIGVMEALNKTADRFNAHDLDLMQAIAGSAVIALENARLYETLRDHNRRLQAAQPRLIQTEKMAALGRLTASLAHEINNPLQVLQGALGLIGEALDELAQAGSAAGAQSVIRSHVEMALDEVDRLAQSVHRLRDFAQSGRSPLQTVDLGSMIGQVLDLTAPWIAAHQITVDRREPVAAAEREIVASPDYLKQLLLNLVLNAIDTMPQGGVLRLETRAGMRGGEGGLHIAISDTGPNIPAALLPRVFEPFQAVRANDSSLGLSICYELAASLGGKIQVTSEHNRGTTFAVWLPSSPGENAS